LTQGFDLFAVEEYLYLKQI